MTETLEQIITDPPLPATTTTAEDLVTAGQRKVNLIWERTQAAIAIGITIAYIYAQVRSISAPGLDAAFFLVIGFYFSRTNHSAIGGVGTKPDIEYRGR